MAAAADRDALVADRVGVPRVLADGELRGAVLFCGPYDMTTVGDSGFPALRAFLWAYTWQRDWLEFDRTGELSTTTTATSVFLDENSAEGTTS